MENETSLLNSVYIYRIL